MKDFPHPFCLERKAIVYSVAPLNQPPPHAPTATRRRHHANVQHEAACSTRSAIVALWHCGTVAVAPSAGDPRAPRTYARDFHTRDFPHQRLPPDHHPAHATQPRGDGTTPAWHLRKGCQRQRATRGALLWHRFAPQYARTVGAHIVKSKEAQASAVQQRCRTHTHAHASQAPRRPRWTSSPPRRP